ncbi:sugar kinase [Dinoroseobacter sp. S76]|uniref:sugar kinase n=1 Tax=Dinoroseobacter sp. S76 TaxID=3415124 RepID=UPI003C7BE951
MSGLHIACIGEAMLELLVSDVPGPARIGVAGDVLNTAIYLRRGLPAPHRVSFVSLVGQDRLSDGMLRFIEEHGVETDLIARDPQRLPGLYAISTDGAGERSFSYWRKDSAARLLFQESSLFDELTAADVIYLSGITLAILPPEIRQQLFTWIDSYRARGGRFAFDSNYRPILWERPSVAREVMAAAWARCDLALPSVDDEMALFGDASPAEVLARLGAFGSMTGALKQGADGPVSIGETVPPEHYEPAVAVVDTTAAGDGFNGGYLAARLTGASQATALHAGHSLACRIIGHPGAILPQER